MSIARDQENLQTVTSTVITNRTSEPIMCYLHYHGENEENEIVRETINGDGGELRVEEKYSKSGAHKAKAITIIEIELKNDKKFVMDKLVNPNVVFDVTEKIFCIKDVL
ncbi:unnamed protein product [Didymodactylos carnosus]|uniref:Uncharacterized protein n=1 Tax=Didymodactylos carnosus TaxID=1234261 RepID=A0A815CPZ3_9BILA|nr:unnamed protein product [Didymodactylos carnosus]CAF1287317.1 unnamed protein product [Didymodactylos carnosus]CAF3858531.1 unnamed protein product [Didymodactylos carnosus]CAF4089804.1 unnamed protein product [Didymodactylos carnosus]